MSVTGTSNGSAMSIEQATSYGFHLLNEGKQAEAADLVRRLLGLSKAVPIRLLECEVAVSGGHLDQAMNVLNDAIIEHGQDATLFLKQARVLLLMRDRSAATAAALHAAAVSPDDSKLLRAIAQLFTQCNDPVNAKPVLLRALRIAPNDPTILYDAALCHYFLNEMEAASPLLDQLIAVRPHDGAALHLRSNLRTQSQAENHIEDLKHRATSSQASAHDLSATYFALAKELEDIGDFAESFQALSEANRIKRSTLRYSVNDEITALNRVMAHYSKSRLDAIPEGYPATGPIFIVGMPRTGTTLVERLLGSHSEVISIGEVTDFPVEMGLLAKKTQQRLKRESADLVEISSEMDFTELGQNYFRLAGQLANKKTYFIDKLPFNFRYCGLISKALPNAKILHLSRDPMDTCYAVFKTLFYNVYHFSYQLDELADFYIGYRKMMAHWHSAMPGKILDIRYEHLVNNFEDESKRILDWCNIPWQDSVLNFHESASASTTASAAQVRRPVYRSSVQKWRHFAAQLEPVRQRLEAAGLVDATGNPLLPPLQ